MNLGGLMVKLALPNGTTPLATTGGGNPHNAVANQSSEGTKKNGSKVLEKVEL